MPDVYYTPNDTTLQQIAETARNTIRFFWRELFWENHRIVKGLAIAAFKAPFSDEAEPRPDDPNVEHMWVGDVSFDGTRIAGRLLNSPNALREWSAGDVVDLELGEITDWMYALGGDRVYGAFTVQLMRTRMSPEERAQHDAAWGLEFGDPSEPLLVPWADTDAEHPMAINMVPKGEEALRADPSQVNQRNARGWTLLHEHALAGSESLVRVLLELGADRTMTTPGSTTAHQLAVAGGWKRTAALLA